MSEFEILVRTITKQILVGLVLCSMVALFIFGVIYFSNYFPLVFLTFFVIMLAWFLGWAVLFVKGDW